MALAGGRGKRRMRGRSPRRDGSDSDICCYELIDGAVPPSCHTIASFPAAAAERKVLRGRPKAAHPRRRHPSPILAWASPVAAALVARGSGSVRPLRPLPRAHQVHQAPAARPHLAPPAQHSQARRRPAWPRSRPAARCFPTNNLVLQWLQPLFPAQLQSLHPARCLASRRLRCGRRARLRRPQPHPWRPTHSAESHRTREKNLPDLLGMQANSPGHRRQRYPRCQRRQRCQPLHSNNMLRKQEG